MDPHSPQERKRALRAGLSAARRARGAADLERARAAIADLTLVAAVAGGWRCVAAYEPMRTEPGSVGLLERLAANGMQVLVPVTLPDRDLDWAVRGPGGKVGGSLGLDAVSRVDAVLVPALAVDRDGVRLGRGGGSYDRALARCSPGCRLLALVFDDEVLDALPNEPWDVAVHAAITPTGEIALGTGPHRNTGGGPGDVSP